MKLVLISRGEFYVDGISFLEILQGLKIQMLIVWRSKSSWLCGSLVRFHHHHPRLSSEVIAADSTVRYHGLNLDIINPPTPFQVAKLHGKRSATF